MLITGVSSARVALVANLAALLLLAPAASAQVGFASAARFDLRDGQRPVSAALGDLNGDGRLDITTANEDSGNVSVLIGTGTGGFRSVRSVNLGGARSPQSLALGDLNGDALIDVVTANSISHDVSVLLGTGNGGFAPARSLSLGGARSPHSVAVADVTGDARPDLFTANRDTNDVSVLPGSVGGGFGTATNRSLGGATEPVAVALADLNRDGELDLATANLSDNISVLLGTGRGAFGAAANLGMSGAAEPLAIAHGDLNGDGRPDLATANLDTDNVSVFLSASAGGFRPARNFGLNGATEPVALALGDLNGDGMLDLATANQGSDNVSVLAGRRGGTFGIATAFNLNGGRSPASVMVADLNSDRRSDIASVNGGSSDVSLLVNAGRRSFPRCGGFRPTIVGGDGGDRMTGTSGRDVIVGLRGGDSIPGRDRGDVICGGAGADRLTGDPRSRYRGGPRSSASTSPSPVVPGSDRLFGGPGDDRLSGGRGRDRLSGGEGSDRIAARDGERDAVDCGRGRRDVAVADRLDRVRRCERVRRR